MWLAKIRAERRRIEDEIGYVVDCLLIRPELMNAICEETDNCPFGILEYFEGMIVFSSDLLPDDFTFKIDTQKIDFK